MNNNINIANSYDLLQIREIWDEIFPAEKEYQDFMFSQIIPLCTSYVLKGDSRDVVSVASLMPMNFINEEMDIHLRGWYMFGVATKSGYEGNGYASALISHIISKSQTDGYDFIFERPANQELINFYLKFGFTELIKKQRYSFGHLKTPKIITEIRERFKTRFEWANPILIDRLIQLGEIERHNELQTEESFEEKCYIAVRNLTKLPSHIFNNTFFCFPME